MKPEEMRTVADLKNVDRIDKTIEELKDIKNKSYHKIKAHKFTPEECDKGKNYSYCDFDGADLSGLTFFRSNFSFSVGLDTVKTNSKTKFVECNMSGADLPDEKLMVKCNTKRFTDVEIKEFFKEPVEVVDISKEIK